ncbi:cyclohexanecarboxylate-CoA ligase [Polynucleobacter sp. SHI8]|uniref:class I adenylate-forming enzyme family protein n=1 Tax=unclassified Polynucleobacter TaxID=2640945 RepID=UPI00249135B6|nr:MULTISPECIES: class I adenylate-forming enzyme family protein [unclassified Polynucleobacter]BDW11040.1 cyclohexanecarboxylate-CoA ligase [Polynucleobacter sp. SHI2]BDW13486.1 cyclohexanecarboxylate-CoA ligase [Polynucleobacter sp. SHI8]
MMLTLLSYQKAQEYYAAGYWQDDTLYSLLVNHAKEKGDSFALRDGLKRITWKGLLHWVDSISEVLHQAGLKQGDRVAIWLPSRVEGVATFLACSRNGYVACPSLHQNYTANEILEFLKRSRAAALVLMPGYGANKDTAQFAAEAFQLSDMKLVLSVEPVADDSVQDFPQINQQINTSVDATHDPEAIVYLAFTSGTTGTPKGVMHSSNTLLANGRAMVQDWKYPENTVILSLSPMSHHIGTVGLEQWIVGAYELVLNHLPEKMSIIDWIVYTKATYLMGVPTHAMNILEDLAKKNLNTLGDVKIFYMAGVVIPIEVAQAFLDMGITPQNIYGMTENGSHQFTSPGDDAKTIVETCGRAAYGYQTKIVDQNNPDIDVGIGEVGEIATKGALLMLGYYNNQVATEDSFNRDGWFLSGDLGTLDENNCLRIVGRKKDLIIRGGHNIHPSHIEELSYRHQAVLKCAAFSVPDTRLGEKVALGIIFKDGVPTMTGEEFLNHLYVAGLSKYDMPEYFGIFTSFPLTASGKILKREIQEQYQSGTIQLNSVRFIEPKK